MTIDEQIEFLKKGTVDFIREDDLRKKLERSRENGKTSYASNSVLIRPRRIFISDIRL